MPRVLNKYHGNIPPDAIFVLRPSKFSNPYRLPNYYKSQTRDVKVMLRKSLREQYRQYVNENPWLIEAIQRELKGKDIVCVCAPLPCHADVLLEIANEDVNGLDEVPDALEE